MFDDAPTNLPVEPPVAPAAAAPTEPLPPPPPPVVVSAPSTPVATPTASRAPDPGVVPGGKKEPEDIFAGLDDHIKAPDASHAPMEPVGPVPKTRLLSVIIGVVAVLVVAGGSYAAYEYFKTTSAVPAPLQPTAETQNAPVVTAAPQPVAEAPVVQVAEEQPTPTPTPVTTVPDGVNVPLPTVGGETPASSEPTSTEPAVVPVQLVEAVDTDRDGLTNSEEIILGTDQQVVDSEGDGFNDGAEVKSGYDPAKAKSLLVDSVHMQAAMLTSGVRAFIPRVWTVTSAKGTTGAATIETGTLVSFDVRVDTIGGGTLTAWVSSNVPDAKNLVSAKTRAGNEVMTTADGLTAYVRIGDRVVVIVYALHGAPSVEFRSLFDVIVQTVALS